MPYWYPAELFEITGHVLPFKYYFNFSNEDISVIAGYKEYINWDHNTGIKEREKGDIEKFLKRKKEIDEFENLIK